MIPIAKPCLGNQEIEAVSKVIESGWVTQGPKVLEFENEFCSKTGANYACAVSNCTTGLHLALSVSGVKRGDYVLTVSHSFIATANSIRHCGAEPIFIDIDLETFNMSPDGLKNFLEEKCNKQDGATYFKRAGENLPQESPLCQLPKEQIGRIAAILVVHQIGMPCNMDRIMEIAEAYSIPVIEDAACAIGSEIYRQKTETWQRIGSPIGELTCFSFHPRKVLTTGDGGMITTNSKSILEKLRLLRQHGMSVSDLARHKSSKYVQESYEITGFNFRLTDVQAAIGIEQLYRLDEVVLARRRIAQIYREELKPIAWLETPFEPKYARSNWQSYAVTLTDDAKLERDEFIQSLMDQQILAKGGIMNAHVQPPYKGSKYELPNSEKVNKQSVLLPLYPQMTDDEISCIIKAIKSI